MRLILYLFTNHQPLSKQLLIFAFFFYCITASSQSVFEINFTLPDTNNTKAKGLLFMGKDNPDFMRLSFTNTATNQPVILDMEFPTECNTIVYVPELNETYIYYRAVVSKIVTGNWPKKFGEIMVWFYLDKDSTNKFIPCTTVLPTFAAAPEKFRQTMPGSGSSFPPVPVAVTDSSIRMVDAVPSNILAYKEISKRQLTKSYLSTFFANRELNYPGPYTIKQLTNIQQALYVSLYCIIVTNTTDPKISESCNIDKENVTRFFSMASKRLYLNYKEINVSGKNFTVQGVTNAIKKLPVKENDIVVFAYTGHGFSYTDDDKYPFAQMALFHNDSTKAQYRAHSMNLETAFNMIQAKKARLTIVLGDCCNSLINIPRYEDPTIEVHYPGVSPVQLRRNLLSMFIDAKGSYLLGATKKGQYAAGTRQYGGLLIYSFTETLANFSYSKEDLNPATVWNEIINTTGSYAKYKSMSITCPGGNPCEQDMIYKAVPKK